MRLSTAGTPNNFAKTVTGVVSREPLPVELRATKILVCDTTPDHLLDLAGYAGFVTSAKPVLPIECPPSVFLTRETSHLRNGDIISIGTNGFIRTLFRPDSDHNVIFTTERCNSNCLMCSQPPQDRDDVGELADRNLELIKLLQTGPSSLTITGGEPTLLGDRLIELLVTLREKFPETKLHMLTNGRTLAWSPFTARLAAINHPNLTLGIPLYSDSASIHDYVVQAHGAFDQTIIGLHQAARYGLRIELRVVLHAITIPRLTHLAEYIYRNLTFVEHVALMGLEHIGYAPRNMQSLWIDPYDYQDQLASAVEILSSRMMNVSIYNLQLCVLRRDLWKFSRNSISDWKNSYRSECNQCQVRSKCGGFFQWNTKLHSAHIKPVSDTDISLHSGR